MKAIVMSDSHGDQAGLRFLLEKAWTRTGHVDAYFHMGDGVMDLIGLEAFVRAHDPDCAIHGVRGNCDFYAPDIGRSLVVPFGGTRLFAAHGHDFRVKSTLTLLDEEAAQQDCTIALFGHTHEPAMEMRSVLMINPGSVMDSRLGFLEVTDGRPRVQLWDLR